MNRRSLFSANVPWVGVQARARGPRGGAVRVASGALRRLFGLGSSLTGLSLGVFIALSLLSQSRPWQALELKGFDLLSVLTSLGQSLLPITIVAIDETSFAEIGLQWPWPRTLHAQLVERLREEGAAVIAFDVLFAEPTQPEADRRFAEAIEHAGNVVLAADLVYRESALLRQWMRVDPIPALRQAGARSGMAGLTPDVDAVVRQIPDYRDSFWREIIAAFNETRPGILGEPTVEAGSLIRYLGPNHTFFYISYYQALNPPVFLPKGVFKDHIVLAGRDVDAGPEVDAAQADMFATPFTLQTRRLTPGVELHANVLENVLLQCAIRPASSSGVLLLLAFSVAAAAVLMPNWRPLPSAGAMLALLAIIMGLDWVLFEYANLGGFTAFSERLSPEEVAQILIQHFTEMTAIILRYGGTVDKFIGDAIMAFWGAPIHNPEQGIHACRAALEMQQVMRVTRKDLRARGFLEINMRIGIHSGEAVVGNMGSESRFDYTAVGDNVNLASRLEGVNKLYRTEILLTDVTASQVRSAVRLRRVDRVRVKGKSKPVEIFTLAVDDAPLELNDAAIEACRNRNRNASTQRWREWLDHVPEDCVAHVYLKRIEGFRREPPVEDWDGSIALEKM